ncbi:MAG: hypothetical protein L6R40_001938 [Gallowayella cf. fulva]|nr:MAG: hypothetical protein L6R40_001938 [Xanthomendoza cf. fulva]
MSYPVSALSPAPFGQQLQRRHCSVQLWPDFKPASTQSSNSNLSPKNTQTQSPRTALDYAFSAAYQALSGGVTTQLRVPPTSTAPFSSDRSNDEIVPIHDTTVERSLKRNAEAANLLGAPEDVKKQKIMFVGPNDLPIKRRPGRPRKTTTATPKPKKALKALRANKPVQTVVHMDIWCTILKNGHPLVASTMKNVAQRFRRLLLFDNPAIWRTARLNTFGHDHPDPPPNLNEWQYANLLVGIGCQAKGCKDKKTRRVCWAFQRRWCNTCMKKNVIMESGCGLALKKYPDIIKCVPSVSFDQYGVYQCIGDYEPGTVPPWLRIDPWAKKAYLRADFARTLREFEEFESRIDGDGPEVSDVRMSWVDDKKKANEELVKKLQAIEHWAETYKADKDKGVDQPTGSASESGTSNTREREVSERIQPRAQSPSATAPKNPMVAGEEQVNEPLTRHPDEYENLSRARQERRCSETDYVLVLARHIVEDMDGSSEPIMDGDFVRIALMETFQRYQEHRDVETPYKLLMDDARLVYQEVLKPMLDSRARYGHHKRQVVTGSVRCPGCKRGRGNKNLYNFPALMTHIFESHANDSTGDFDYFDISRAELPSDVDFPWCYVEWPRNLPIPAVGQDTSGRWDVHAKGEKHPRPSYCVDPSPQGPGAFDDRVAAVSVGPLASEFVKNVLYAASQLEESSIGDTFKTQITLEYAVRKFESARGVRPGFELLEALQLGLMLHGVKGLFEGFRCQQCCEAVVREGKTGYFARSVKPLGRLIEHFQKTHLKGGDWTRDMLNLPTAQDLLAELQLPCNKSAYTIFQQLFPTNVDSTLDPQLRQMTGLDAAVMG